MTTTDATILAVVTLDHTIPYESSEQLCPVFNEHTLSIK